MEEDELFHLYESLLVHTIRPSSILPYLLRENLPNIREKCTELMIAEADDYVESTRLLFRIFLAISDDKEKYRKMINSLKNCDKYEDLGELLEGPADIKNSSKLKLLLQEEFYKLLKFINPKYLLKDLHKDAILSKHDLDTVEKLIDKKDNGDIRALMTIIDRMSRRKSDWFEVFLALLDKNGFKFFTKKVREHLGLAGIPAASKRTDDDSSDEIEAELPPTSMRPITIGRAESPVIVDASTNRDSPMQQGSSLFSEGIAQDSDEEEEMLERAIQMSMRDKSSNPSLHHSKDSETKMAEETLPKRHYPTTDFSKNCSTAVISEVNKKFQNDHISITPKTKQLKLNDNEPNDSTNLSQEELRKHRLAYYTSGVNNSGVQDTKTTCTETCSQTENNTVSKKDYRKCDGDRRPYSNVSLQTPESTGTAKPEFPSLSLDLTIHPDPEWEQEQFDVEYATKLQKEEDRLSSKRFSIDFNRPRKAGKIDYSSRPSTSFSDNITQEENDRELARSIQEEEYAGSKKIINTCPQGGHVESSDDEKDSDAKPEELRLRSYQEELARSAKEGKNTIIVAPTGSGKTHVALGISKHHFENADYGEDPKIVFIVPTVALVEQQWKQYKTFLSEEKSIGICGDTGLKMSIAEILDHYNIFIVTPAIIVNSLNERDIKSLDVFTLIIFDECHHTFKDHPYNTVMRSYFKEKNSNPGIRLPQIVGLTASPGVGKADRTEAAVRYILTLCANLDARICTVRENKLDLKQNVNNPKEATYEVPGRKVDHFQKILKKMMTEIEEKIKDQEHKGREVQVADFGKKLLAPAEKGRELYSQWISTLKRTLTELNDQGIRRILTSCLDDLQVYNTALMLNDDCRSIDALEYIQKKIETNEYHREVHDETETWLMELYGAQKDNLTFISTKDDYPNPKLTKLRSVIVDYYKVKPDSRGIIFCKTRELTIALTKWITSDPEMEHLGAYRLVGSNQPNTRGGMTQNMIEDTLKYFKDGEHKIIVATTVAEEGLDISKCNLVIRYDFVTNETARIQAKGRGRAEDAIYILFAQKGGGVVEKETLNKMREQLMHKAMEKICDMSHEVFYERLKTLQTKARIDTEMKKLGMQKKKASSLSTDENIYELRCMKCDAFACFSCDVKKIEQSHHIVIDLEFKEKVDIIVIPYPQTFQKFQQHGKIYCKKCHNDWGQQAKYNNNLFFVVKSSGFLIIGPNRHRGVFKKWKDVPFEVKNLTAEDLGGMLY